MKKRRTDLQNYPREPDGSLLASATLFPNPSKKLSEAAVNQAIDAAFQRALKNKKGEKKPVSATAEALVKTCLQHLRERSDPILSPSFVASLDPQDLFELDAVSHEMQRHRMTIGVFYQFLLLELMKARGWQVFDGTLEGDVVTDIQTPGLGSGLRLYISVKKSKDTVGGQDVLGVIKRLEAMAKSEKNLTSPYLCVLAVATPYKGRINTFENDRTMKYNKDGVALSLNCEYWGPGFIFPFISGFSAQEIYKLGFKKVAGYLPFQSLKFRQECAKLLSQELATLKLISANGKIDALRFLDFVTQQPSGGKNE